MKNAFASQVLTSNTFEDAPEEVSCPVEVLYIWEWFTELSSARPNTGMGISPIPHTEITAWSEGVGIKLLPFERRALREIDNAFISHFTPKPKNG